jgi:hypothetical protein
MIIRKQHNNSENGGRKMINPYTRNSNEKLLERIKEKRSELINLAAHHGLTSNNVVNCSQELDSLIYQILLVNKNGRRNEMLELSKMDGIHG